MVKKIMIYLIFGIIGVTVIIAGVNRINQSSEIIEPVIDVLQEEKHIEIDSLRVLLNEYEDPDEFIQLVSTELGTSFSGSLYLLEVETNSQTNRRTAIYGGKLYVEIDMDY